MRDPRRTTVGAAFWVMMLAILLTISGDVFRFLFLPFKLFFDVAVASVDAFFITPLQFPPIGGVVVGVILGLAVAVAHRYTSVNKLYPITTFDRDVHFVRERRTENIDWCVNCDKRDVPGYTVGFGTVDVLFGIESFPDIDGTIEECVKCREADEIEHALRRERDDPDVPVSDEPAVDPEDIVTCRLCGTHNAASREDCGECGHPLPVASTKED